MQCTWRTLLLNTTCVLAATAFAAFAGFPPYPLQWPRDNAGADGDDDDEEEDEVLAQALGTAPEPG